MSAPASGVHYTGAMAPRAKPQSKKARPSRRPAPASKRATAGKRSPAHKRSNKATPAQLAAMRWIIKESGVTPTKEGMEAIRREIEGE